MIVGMGIDSVQVQRFNDWSTIPLTQLKKVFSEEEIAYCLKVPRLSAQRFAVRFAVREAFFKAFSVMQKSPLPFLRVCKTLQLMHTDNNVPLLKVDWPKLAIDPNESNSFLVHCSLTHTADAATACVILETIENS